MLARGGGSSQAGQTVNSSLVIDCSKHLDRILDLDVPGRRCVVEPGIVLDELNRRAQAARPVVPGRHLDRLARHHRRHDRQQLLRRPLAALRQHARERHLDRRHAGGRQRRRISGRRRAICPTCRRTRRCGRWRATCWRSAAREADEIAARFPKVQRRVGGYNIDALVPGRNDLNLAHILVGSEGTLAFSTAHRAEAFAAARPPRGRRLPFRQLPCRRWRRRSTSSSSAPIAVELVDRTMIALARDIAMFRPTLEAFVRGEPEAMLLVEFAEAEQDENVRRLPRLHELIGDLGFAWSTAGDELGRRGRGARSQAAGRDHRAAHRRPQHHDVDEGGGQSRSRSSRTARCRWSISPTTPRGSPTCSRGTAPRGTWYAHASVGCLHVRPMLNLRLDKDVKAMRAIAEEAFAHGARLQGLAFRRAWRRHRALGVPRARCSARGWCARSRR